MPIYSSDSDDDHQQLSRSSSTKPTMRLFGFQRSMYSTFGGRRVADVLLWRDKTMSAATLAGFTFTWFLFEVVEYHLITLACYFLMGLILTLFVWNFGADFIRRRPPSVHDFKVSESTIRYITGKINKLLAGVYQISSGQDLPSFLMVMTSLWILSVMGSYTSALSFAYISYLCLTTIPVLYERYEKEVEYLATQGNRDMRRLFNKLDSKVLSRIPRGPVKDKKYK